MVRHSNHSAITPRIIAIGDSPADAAMFELSDYSIAINPKGDIAEKADVIIEDDLAKAIPLIENMFLS